ncbi:hypothetical protein SSX86_032676 [Deinandra increscens subsp. villosa]|uniref:SWIM-type domain-containing protein n=1 Tax=Deinandra increscens subsp. villosa TaxID=3103831 RepID=A0AAP0C6M0_9ASTR
MAEENTGSASSSVNKGIIMNSIIIEPSFHPPSAISQSTTHIRKPTDFVELDDFYDTDIQLLANNEDILKLLQCLTHERLIDVYVEHGESALSYSGGAIQDFENVNSDYNSENDSDFNLDEGDEMVDDEVDMTDFKLNVDEDIEINNDGEEVVEESLDNDMFDGVINEQLLTRRQLRYEKDDKDRLRVQCRGELPTFDINNKDGIFESQAKIVACAKLEGPKNKNVGGRGKKTNPQIYLCPWTLLVSIDKESGSWMVKTFIEKHTCRPTRDVFACTAPYLSRKILEQIEENPTIPVKAVQEQLQRKFEVGVSQMKAFRAKSLALKQVHGDYSSQYHLLRDYIEELKMRNPGTTVKLEVEPPSDPDSETRRFKRIYICLGALKEGFRCIGRELLGVDGSFMKGPYPGQILTAVGLDPNNGIYPLAYAVVEAENISSWTWFLTALGDDLNLGMNSNFTFISDRQKARLIKICLWKLATCITVRHFEFNMRELKKLSDDAHSWLSKIPPQHWSRSHFSGRAHSDVLLNNMCEVLNSKLIGGRDKPILTVLEFIREYLMKRIVSVLQVIDRSDGPLTPYATRMFEVNKKEASKFTVQWNGGGQYQVTGPYGEQRVVDVIQKSCTCRKWEVTGIPCKHAVVTMWNMADNAEKCDTKTWVHPVYKVETWKKVYSFKIYPINDRSMWPKSRVPTTITPPTHHKNESSLGKRIANKLIYHVEPMGASSRTDGEERECRDLIL